MITSHARTFFRRSLQAVVGLLFLCGHAAAMSEKEASENLMYFAFAMKEGEHCESLGYPGMALLRKWEAVNADILMASLRRVEDHAVATGKVTRDQGKEVAFGLFVRLKERYDRDIAPSKSARSCAKFGETLRDYRAKLVAE